MSVPNDTPLMRGGYNVRHYVALFLSVAVPRVLTIAREKWSLDEYTLPEPKRYDAYDPSGVDEWPLMGVSLSSASGMEMYTLDDLGQQEVSPRYAVRVYGWCRTPMDASQDWISPYREQSIRLRDDLADVTRAALLGNLSLGNENFFLIQETFSVDYSDDEELSGGRFAAAFVHSFDLEVDESVVELGVGIAEEINVEYVKVRATEGM